MDVKQVLSFIKIEHTLFSLPFVLMGYIIAVHPVSYTHLRAHET